MDEEATTSTQVDDTQAADTQQPDETTNEQAVDEVKETTDATSSTDSQESDDGDDLTWAEKKGIKLDDPAAVAKMLRESERKITQTSQEANKLKDSVTTASAELDDVQQLRNEVAVMSFYQTYPDARQLDTEMAKVLDDKPYFANDLEGLYFYTKGMQADKGIVAARQAGSKEALAAAAQAERAAAPKASATVRTSPKQLTDEDIRNMSVREYEQAKADGLIEPWARA